mmetsp:Transcript_49789/g.82652  ORF Transcript_49789/g.82652 Transcript_49789/m.82652 type:complete len:413 (-) Transcript_49789:127-1365(-)
MSRNESFAIISSRQSDICGGFRAYKNAAPRFIRKVLRFFLSLFVLGTAFAFLRKCQHSYYKSPSPWLSLLQYPYSLSPLSQTQSHTDPNVIIHAVNSDPKSSWQATNYDEWQASGVYGLGTTLDDEPVHKTNSDIAFNASAIASLWSSGQKIRQSVGFHTEDIVIPESFDARDQWPGFIHGVKNQHFCGNCWALQAADVLADRLAIMTEGRLRMGLSAQNLLSCDRGRSACGGGRMGDAWRLIKEKGVVEEDCFPYPYNAGHVPRCRTRCIRWLMPFRMFRAKTYYPVARGILDMLSSSHRVRSIQEEIYRYGPVQAGFHVYEDFRHYHVGVYSHSAGSRLSSAHAIKIIGWGTDDGGVDYWLCQNSWGKRWGEKGYFRIRRGTNECEIESHVIGGLPDEEPYTLTRDLAVT